jgi:hypothetical protein
MHISEPQVENKRVTSFAALDAGDAIGLTLTVQDALNAYIKDRHARGPRAGQDAKSRGSCPV